MNDEELRPLGARPDLEEEEEESFEEEDGAGIESYNESPFGNEDRNDVEEVRIDDEKSGLKIYLRSSRESIDYLIAEAIFIKKEFSNGKEKGAPSYT